MLLELVLLELELVLKLVVGNSTTCGGVGRLEDEHHHAVHAFISCS